MFWLCSEVSGVIHSVCVGGRCAVRRGTQVYIGGIVHTLCQVFDRCGTEPLFVNLFCLLVCSFLFMDNGLR